MQTARRAEQYAREVHNAAAYNVEGPSDGAHEIVAWRSRPEGSEHSPRTRGGCGAATFRSARGKRYSSAERSRGGEAHAHAHPVLAHAHRPRAGKLPAWASSPEAAAAHEAAAARREVLQGFESEAVPSFGTARVLR
jgi:hypothetical protein